MSGVETEYRNEVKCVLDSRVPEEPGACQRTGGVPISRWKGVCNMKASMSRMLVATLVVVAGLSSVTYAAEPAKQKTVPAISAPAPAPTPTPAAPGGTGGRSLGAPVAVPDQPEITLFDMTVYGQRTTNAVPASQLRFRWAVRPGRTSPIQGVMLSTGGRTLGPYAGSSGEIEYILPAETASGTKDFVLRARNQIGRESTRTLSIRVLSPAELAANMRSVFERALFTASPSPIPKRAGASFSLEAQVSNTGAGSMVIPNGLSFEAVARATQPSALTCPSLENQGMTKDRTNRYTLHCTMGNPSALYFSHTGADPTGVLSVQFKYRGTAIYRRDLNLVERSFLEVR